MAACTNEPSGTECVQDRLGCDGIRGGGAAIDPDGPAGYLLFRDALFRRKKKNGWHPVESPYPVLETSVFDTHAHLASLSDAPLALARCAVHDVDAVCTIVDACEDGEATYDMLDVWRGEALRILPDVFAATRTAASAVPCDHEGMSADAWRANRCPCAETPIPRVRVAAGVHPHNAERWDASLQDRLYAMLARPATCALGEVGLDYHYDLSPRAVQRDVFRRQTAMANECGLPLILHMRDAHDDGFAILEEEGWPAAGVLLHCCSVGPEELARWIDRGCFVACGGAVTFARSEDLRASACSVPLDRLLVETDAPYMAPVPLRGVECSPEFTVLTAAYLAALRGVEPGEPRRVFLRTLHDNASALLDRAPSAWQAQGGPR